MTSGYLTGNDAIDLARISGLSLNRAPCRPGEVPDTSPAVADQLIAGGTCTAEDFYIDLDRLSTPDAGCAILSLVGILKAWLDYCTAVEHA